MTDGPCEARRSCTFRKEVHNGDMETGIPIVIGAVPYSADLAKYVEGIRIVNGKRLNSPETELNGPGRLAAYLVKRLHNDKHEPDLHSSRGPCGQEFEYVISVDEKLLITVEVFDGPMTAFGCGGEKCNNRIFVGTVEAFTEYVKNA